MPFRTSSSVVSHYLCVCVCVVFALSLCRCGDSSTFDGCLVFDEAHKAKNFNSAKEENSTKIAQAVIKIQVREPTPSTLAEYHFCRIRGVWPCCGECTNVSCLPTNELVNHTILVAAGGNSYHHLDSQIGLWYVFRDKAVEGMKR